MKQLKKATALLVFAVILLLPIFSGCYIKANTNHDCTRNNCPVCVEIKFAKHFLTSFKFMISGACFSMLFVGCSIMLKSNVERFKRMHTTLITLKVELLD